METIHNKISNMGIPAKGFMFSFENSESQPMTVIHPLRRLGTSYYQTTTYWGDRSCNFTPAKPSDNSSCPNYQPKEDVYFQAHLERKNYDFFIAYDVSNSQQTDSMEIQKMILDLLLRRVFTKQDRVYVTKFGYSQTYFSQMVKVPPKSRNYNNTWELVDFRDIEMMHMNWSNINFIEDFCVYNNTENYTMAGNPNFILSKVEELFDWRAIKTNKNFVTILFLRGKLSEPINDVSHPIITIYLSPYDSIYNDTVDICDASFRSGGRCFLYNSGDGNLKSEERKTNISATLKNFIVDSYSTKADQFEIIWIQPFNDTFGSGETFAPTMSIYYPTKDNPIVYGVYSLNLDWNLISHDFCESDSSLIDYISEYIDTNYLALTIQIVGIFSVFLFYIIFIFSLDKLSSFCTNKNKNKFLLNTFYLLKAVEGVNHVWLILFFAMETLFLLLLVDYLISVILLLIGISFLYISLFFCANFFLRFKKKQLGEEKSNSERVRMKGMSLIIQTIVFDDFIKGSFNNFQIKSGELIAIMGHSGAGKSTFYQILMGVYQPKRLSIIVELDNRRAVVSNLKEIRPYVSLTPQSEIVEERLTVFEQLFVAAKMKYKNVNTEIVDYYCKSLGITDELLDKFPSELSGGQKKKLSILKDLVSQSPILLLDEPTSGLDSVATKKLVENLRDLSRKGLAIVMIIHQPSTACMQMFDKLYLFLKDKETVKCGVVENPSDFQADNIDDFLQNPSAYLQKKSMPKYLSENSKDLVEQEPVPSQKEDETKKENEKSKEKEKENEIVKNNQKGRKKPLPKPKKEKPKSFINRKKIKTIKMTEDEEIFLDLFKRNNEQMATVWVKIFYLLPRFCLQEIRDRTGLLTDIFVTVIVGMAIAILFGRIDAFEGTGETSIAKCVALMCGDLKQQTTKDCSSIDIIIACSQPTSNPVSFAIFSLLMGVGLIGIIMGLRIFGGEKNLMKREFRTGIDFVMYFFLKILASIPRSLLMMFLLCCIVYSSVCFRASFFFYYLMTCISLFWAQGVGILTSLFFPKIESSISSALIGIIIILILNLFSGFFVTSRVVVSSEVETFPFNIILDVLKFFSYTYWSNYFLYGLELSNYLWLYPSSVAYALKEFEFVYDIPHYVLLIFAIIINIVLIYSLSLFNLFWFYTDDKLSLYNNIYKFYKSYFPKWLIFDFSKLLSKKKSKINDEELKAKNDNDQYYYCLDHSKKNNENENENLNK